MLPSTTVEEIRLKRDADASPHAHATTVYKPLHLLWLELFENHFGDSLNYLSGTSFMIPPHLQMFLSKRRQNEERESLSKAWDMKEPVSNNRQKSRKINLSQPMCSFGNWSVSEWQMKSSRTLVKLQKVLSGEGTYFFRTDKSGDSSLCIMGLGWICGVPTTKKTI